jgi:hypothetical protein
LGIGQGEQIKRLWKGFHQTLIRDQIITQEEHDGVTKRIEAVLDAQPPPKLSWGYNVHLARKA